MATKVAGMLAIMSLLTDLLGTVTPGWIVIMYSNEFNELVEISIGIMYARICVVDSCNLIPNTEILKHNRIPKAIVNVTFLEPQLEATFGILSILGGIILSFLFGGKERKRTCGIASATILLTGAIQTLVPTGRFAYENMKIYTKTMTFRGAKINACVPYSIILLAFGGISAFVSSVIIICVLCKQKSSPSSGTSKGYVICHGNQSNYQMDALEKEDKESEDGFPSYKS